ncbi:YbfB/YjiJ family MFS transporter, partial [Mangrovicoccus algicola]
ALSRRAGPMPVLLGAMALQAAALAGLAAGDGLLLQGLCAMLFGGSFVVVVAQSLLLAGLGRPEASGQAMAQMTLLYGAGQILGPLVTAQLAAAGGYGLPLLIAAGLGMAGLGLMAAAGAPR